MDSVHIHLLLNHVVILGAIFSFVIYVTGSFLSQRILLRTALIGFVFSALVAIPVFLTGEPAEEVVENIPGITHEIIHEHEEAAEFSIWMIEILGLISLVSLFAAEKYHRILRILIYIFGIVSVVTLAYTALEGGKIRHEELRSNSSLVPPEHNSEADED